MIVRALLALAWLAVVIVAAAVVVCWFVTTLLTPAPPMVRRGRPRVERRIPGRLCRLEDLAPADREVFQDFRRAG